MDSDPDDDGPRLKPPIELTAMQQRVLGVLIEKAMTTPAAYPLTLNALVTGCNQKSNRSPITSYDEDDVEVTLDELQQLDLVALLITSSGKTDRYRHLGRIKFGWNEVELGVMGELLLRGRQQAGELRSRASRMHTIESLDVLRETLNELIEAGYVVASGPVERRGVEIDHALRGYMEPMTPTPEAPATVTTPSATDEIAELRREVDALKQQVARLNSELGIE